LPSKQHHAVVQPCILEIRVDQSAEGLNMTNSRRHLRNFRQCALLAIIVTLLISNTAAAKGSNLPQKVVANTLPVKTKDDTSIFNRLRIRDETKMLPWQASFLFRLFKPNFLQEQEENLLSTSSNAPEKLLSVQILSSFYKWVAKFIDRLSDWGLRHKKNFSIAAKASVLTFLGFAILRRFGNWYKGMAEYEILLDHTDFDYQAYGGCFNGMGSSLTASINQTAVVEYRYSHLMRRLKNSLGLFIFYLKNVLCLSFLFSCSYSELLWSSNQLCCASFFYLLYCLLVSVFSICLFYQKR
jgi:hypothetical protein